MHKEQKRRSLSVLVVIIYLIMVFVRSASSSSSSLLSFLLKSTTTTTSRIKRGSETTRKTIQKYYSSSTTFDRSGETISRDMRRKDLAEETRYFAHEDYELLRKLARKAKRSADEVNPEHGQKLRETERRERERGARSSLLFVTATKVIFRVEFRIPPPFIWLSSNNRISRRTVCTLLYLII